MNLAELGTKKREDLLEMAKDLGISGYSSLKKQEIIISLLRTQAEKDGNIFAGGMLEITNEGYGFLRGENLLQGSSDVYVSSSQIRRFGLRTGDLVMGQARPPKEGERYQSLLRVEMVNDLEPELSKGRPHFESLTPIFPNRMFNLETVPENVTSRMINLIAPVGRGQRGMIVSPPKAGKTLLLKQIANAICTNYEDVHMMVCLIGERPEEVTDMKRSVRGEVVAATFDEMVENQTHVAELALERAKRLVEAGKTW